MLKSFLHQSSDLNRAIAEAWEQSSFPNVFTVKVIDAGKKGFLGFSHRPAKISFTYECGVGQINPGDQLKKTQRPLAPTRPHVAERTFTTDKIVQQNQRAATVNLEKNNAPAKPVVKNVVAEEARAPKTVAAAAPNKKAPELNKRRVVAPKEAAAPKNSSADVAPAKPIDTASLDNWTEPLVQQVGVWLKEFCQVFGQEVAVEVVLMQNELLNIQLTGATLQESTLGILFKDNLFVCACATLVVQSLRNQSGQRFKGLKIRIAS